MKKLIILLVLVGIYLCGQLLYVYFVNLTNSQEINIVINNDETRCYNILDKISHYSLSTMTLGTYNNSEFKSSLKDRKLKELTCKELGEKLFEVSFLREEKFHTKINGKHHYSKKDKNIKVYPYVLDGKYGVASSMLSYVGDGFFLSTSNSSNKIHLSKIEKNGDYNIKQIYRNLGNRIDTGFIYDNLYLFKGASDNYELTIFRKNNSAIKYIFSLNDDKNGGEEYILVNPSCDEETRECMNDINGKKLKLNGLSLDERLSFIDAKGIIEKHQKVISKNDDITVTKIGSEIEDTWYRLEGVDGEGIKIMGNRIPQNIEKIIITPLKVKTDDVIIDYEPFELKGFTQGSESFEYNAFYKYRNYLPHGLTYEINMVTNDGISNKDYLIIESKYTNFSSLDKELYFVLKKSGYVNLIPEKIFPHISTDTFEKSCAHKGSFCKGDKTIFKNLYNYKTHPNISDVGDGVYKIYSIDVFADIYYLFNEESIIETVMGNIKIDGYTSREEISRQKYIFFTTIEDGEDYKSEYTLYDKGSFSYNGYGTSNPHGFMFIEISKEDFAKMGGEYELIINESNIKKLDSIKIFGKSCIRLFGESAWNYYSQGTFNKKITGFKLKFFKNEYTGNYSYLIYDGDDIQWLTNAGCDRVGGIVFIEGVQQNKIN